MRKIFFLFIASILFISSCNSTTKGKYGTIELIIKNYDKIEDKFGDYEDVDVAIMDERMQRKINRMLEKFDKTEKIEDKQKQRVDLEKIQKEVCIKAKRVDDVIYIPNDVFKTDSDEEFSIILTIMLNKDNTIYLQGSIEGCAYRFKKPINIWVNYYNFSK